ncbi:MAG TPA: protein-glutamate O-methyltransferase CheR [candidate division Zixibacteria bacterium]|nr:protein-glutamate O-methyltransferase CheR [candidate division Zixibacteria bacterium]
MNIAPAEFDYLRRLVRDCSAIEIDADKQYLAELRLSPLLPEHGVASVQELLIRLRNQEIGTVHRRVVDAMTNNETWFFRDFHPFKALESNIIPEMITRRSSERQLCVWSAAASTGQEAYSVAMILRDRFTIPHWRYFILGTDISDRVLRRARAGIYSQQEVNRGLPAPMLAKYFQRSGTSWELHSALRDMVTLQTMNLAGPWSNIPPIDIVLLRNVLIYFDIPVRKRILSSVRHILRPDGYMLLGAAETTLNLDDNFERVQFENCVCYRLRRSGTV